MEASDRFSNLRISRLQLFKSGLFSGGRCPLSVLSCSGSSADPERDQNLGQFSQVCVHDGIVGDAGWWIFLRCRSGWLRELVHALTLW